MVSTSERYWLIRSNEYNIFSSDGSVLICLASWLILAPILRSSYIICTSVFDILLPFKADSLIKEERDFPSSFERWMSCSFSASVKRIFILILRFSFIYIEYVSVTNIGLQLGCCKGFCGYKNPCDSRAADQCSLHSHTLYI